MKKILIICQARFSSTRLPGKVLKKVNNKPLLWYVFQRLNQVKTPNKTILATGLKNLNQPIIEFAKNHKIDYFSGSEDDVLDRYYQTSKKFDGDIIVRITSDCPLIDPNIIDYAIQLFLEGDFDYVSNGFPPTYPDGFDVEVFSFNALENAWKDATLPSEREHVTPYLWKNKDKFPQYNFENNIDLSNIRLTVDTIEDFNLISKIIDKFSNKWEDFHMKDVILYLEENPELLRINSQYQRNEGYLKSLEEDKIKLSFKKK